MKALFALTGLDAPARAALLSGRAPGGEEASGPVVCACFGVGLAAVRDAVATGGARSPEDIGRALRAGTSCGSCLPDLRRILAREPAPAAG